MILSSCVNNISVTKNQLIGSWKVNRVIKEPTAQMLKGFSESTFKFDDSGVFQLISTSDSEQFTEIVEWFKEAKWKFDIDEQLIKIGNEEDGYSTMRIYVKKDKGVLLFDFDESEMELEMVKTE